MGKHVVLVANSSPADRTNAATLIAAYCEPLPPPAICRPRFPQSRSSIVKFHLASQHCLSPHRPPRNIWSPRQWSTAKA